MILDFDALMHPRVSAGRKPYDLEGMRQAYRTVFLSPTGKIVLSDIAQRGLLHRVSFTGETPFSTAFNEGKRALALEILHLLNPHPLYNQTGCNKTGRNKTGDPYDGPPSYIFD